MSGTTYAEIWITTWMEIANELSAKDYYKAEAMMVELSAMAAAAHI